MAKVSRTFRLDQDLSKKLDKITVPPYTYTWHIEQALNGYGPIKGLAPKTAPPIVAVREIPSAVDHQEFERVWEMYGRKGNKKTSRSRFVKLGINTKQAIYNHLPAYIASTPDKQYRKGFEVYINLECWNDEIVTSNPSQSQSGMALLADTSWADGIVDKSVIEHEQ
jgi:hypothetical protein